MFFPLPSLLLTFCRYSVHEPLPVQLMSSTWSARNEFMGWGLSAAGDTTPNTKVQSSVPAGAVGVRGPSRDNQRTAKSECRQANPAAQFHVASHERPLQPTTATTTMFCRVGGIRAVPAEEFYSPLLQPRPSSSFASEPKQPGYNETCQWPPSTVPTLKVFSKKPKNQDVQVRFANQEFQAQPVSQEASKKTSVKETIAKQKASQAKRKTSKSEPEPAGEEEKRTSSSRRRNRRRVLKASTLVY